RHPPPPASGTPRRASEQGRPGAASRSTQRLGDARPSVRQPPRCPAIAGQRGGERTGEGSRGQRPWLATASIAAAAAAGSRYVPPLVIGLRVSSSSS